MKHAQSLQAQQGFRLEMPAALEQGLLEKLGLKPETLTATGNGKAVVIQSVNPLAFRPRAGASVGEVVLVGVIRTAKQVLPEVQEMIDRLYTRGMALLASGGNQISGWNASIDGVPEFFWPRQETIRSQFRIPETEMEAVQQNVKDDLEWLSSLKTEEVINKPGGCFVPLAAVMNDNPAQWAPVSLAPAADAEVAGIPVTFEKLVLLRLSATVDQNGGVVWEVRKCLPAVAEGGTLVSPERLGALTTHEALPRDIALIGDARRCVSRLVDRVLEVSLAKNKELAESGLTLDDGNVITFAELHSQVQLWSKVARGRHGKDLHPGAIRSLVEGAKLPAWQTTEHLMLGLESELAATGSNEKGGGRRYWVRNWLSVAAGLEAYKGYDTFAALKELSHEMWLDAATFSKLAPVALAFGYFGEKLGEGSEHELLMGLVARRYEMPEMFISALQKLRIQPKLDQELLKELMSEEKPRPTYAPEKGALAAGEVRHGSTPEEHRDIAGVAMTRKMPERRQAESFAPKVDEDAAALLASMGE